MLTSNASYPYQRLTRRVKRFSHVSASRLIGRQQMLNNSTFSPIGDKLSSGVEGTVRERRKLVLSFLSALSWNIDIALIRIISFLWIEFYTARNIKQILKSTVLLYISVQ